MWMYLLKFSICVIVGFCMNYFEVIETIKWKWNREKIKSMADDEADPLHK